MLKEQTTKRIYGVMHTQTISSPYGHGWKIDEEGAIGYKWTSGFIVPQKLMCSEGGRENYCSVFSVFPICLTWVLENYLGLGLPRQSGASRTNLAYVS